MKAKYWIPLLLIVAIALSACASKAPEMADEAQPAEVYSMGAGESSKTYNSDVSEYALTSTTAAESERVVIKNASVEIIVDDPVSILNQIKRMAEKSGGFIVNSNLYKVTTDQGLEVPAAEITVRVPAEQLEDIMQQIEALLVDADKDVSYENISGEDVTAEYTDLQSRLRNLEDAQQQLQKIMDAAYKTEDVLAVYNQLTSVNEQIEVLRGQIKYYDEAARLSALEVHIIAREGIQEITIGGWEPAGVARDAIQTLIDTLQFLGNAAIWIVLYLLPTALCILIPVYLIILAIRAIKHSRKQKRNHADVKPENPESPQE